MANDTASNQPNAVGQPYTIESESEYNAVEPPFKDEVSRLNENAGVESRPFFLCNDDPHYPRRAVRMVNRVLRQTWGNNLRVADQDEPYYNGGAGDPTPARYPEEGPRKIPTVFKLPNEYAVYTLICSRTDLSDKTIEDRADELGIETTPGYSKSARAAAPRPRYVGYALNPYWDIGVQLDPQNPRAGDLPRLSPPLDIVRMTWHATESAAKKARARTLANYKDSEIFVGPVKKAASIEPDTPKND